MTNLDNTSTETFVIYYYKIYYIICVKFIRDIFSKIVRQCNLKKNEFLVMGINTLFLTINRKLSLNVFFGSIQSIIKKALQQS